MKKKMIKGAVSVALVAAMAASCIGCTKKDGNKSAADPALAKQGVYSYENINLGLGSEDYFNVLSAGKVGDNAQLVVQSYQNDEVAYSIYSVSDDGSVLSSNNMAMPDTSQFDLNTFNEGGYYDDGVIIYEDAVGALDNEHPDVAVLTTGETVEVDDANDAYESEEVWDVDGDYYYEDDYSEDGLYENIYFEDIKIADDGSMVGLVEYYCSGYQNGEYVYCDVNMVCGWTANGDLKWSTMLSEVVDSTWVYVGGSALLENGDYFVLINGDVPTAAIFDTNGNCVNKKPTSGIKQFESIGDIISLKDGSLLVVYYDSDDGYKTKCCKFDVYSFSVKEEVSLPDNVINGGYDFSQGYDTDLITTTNSGLAKFNIGDSEATLFMNFVNSDVDINSIGSIVFIDSEHFIGSYNDSDYNNKIALFSYVDPADIPDKEVVNLGVYYIGFEIRAKVIEFNKSSDKYRIIVTSYSDYATDDDYAAGYKQMNNDIISGNCPDIVIADASYINFATYANKGMLKDFDDLFAADEELKDNEYLTNVFDAFSINGKHYVGIYSFNYESFTGSSNIFGDATSWTIDEFKNMQSSFPAGSQLMPYITQERFLSYIMEYDGYEFVNAETGKCEFDSEDFITLLEYAARLPKENEGDEDYWMDYSSQFRNGKTVLNSTYVYDPAWYQQSRYEYFDGNTAMVGFPSRTGDSSVITADGYPMVIFSKGNVAGSWEFVRQFFTEEYQDELEYAIPVLESSFDKWADKGMERPYWEYDGQIEYFDNYYYIDGVEHVVPVMTQADVDELKNAIRSCSKRNYFNKEILEIIEEECSACFAGQKTAREVATIIQSRVQLYINENN